jgi:sigma-B regulation protein RsbU (phosphoserine phosphatase)
VSRGRILVVDDEPGMLRAVERVLAADYTVLALGTPAEALAQWIAFEPDLALLDVRLPGMTGLDLMDRLRIFRPDLDVILMTGSQSETDATHVDAILRKAFYFIQKPFDRRVLLTLVERCLELRRLESDNLRHVERLENELAEARAFQESLLPAPRARLGCVEVAARSIPSAELGGDFVAYADAGSGRVALLVADVAGHGASAAMLTGMVKYAFDSAHADGCDPQKTVRKVLDGLRSFEPRRFVTLLVVLLDPERGALEWVNAGHPPGLHWSPGHAPARLTPTGLIASSAFADRIWTAEKRPLLPGDRLLLFTDGLVELEREGEQFGLERILECIAARSEGGPPLIDDLLAAADAFGGLPGGDDVTLLAASVR